MLRSALAVAALLLGLAASAPAETNPAVLFASPSGAAGGWVDLDYLRELQGAGFDVDYTERLEDLTPERIARYHVVVLYVTPDAFDVTMRGAASSPEKVRATVELFDAYVVGGGGLLLMPSEQNMLKQMLADLTAHWGARLPVERIRETDLQKLGTLVNVNQHVPLAWTDEIPASPVSEGVRRVWYPVAHAYNAQHTGPIDVDDAWQVVLRGSKTTVTEPVDLARSTSPVLENPFIRPEGVAAPPIMAIRGYGQGRIALLNTWRQYSVGSGTRFIFSRQVLSAGVGDRPSDFGRLLENTYRWLAQPAIARGTPGGYTTPPDRLLPPNRGEAIRADYADRFWPYDPASLARAEVPEHLRLFRGLLGAKTSAGGGSGSVEDYARAAREAGLDFVVFLDDFARLTREELAATAAECRRLSDGTLLLLPGFTLRNNVGNRMFFYGPDPAWPPDYCLTRPVGWVSDPTSPPDAGRDDGEEDGRVGDPTYGKNVLAIQEENDRGGFTGYLSPFLDWVLTAYHVEKGQVGYFDFAGSPGGMRPPALRLYAMLGVRTFREGKLVEDVTDEYLATAQGTIPPAPASVVEVSSPDELRQAVDQGCDLLFARGRSLPTLFHDALRWTHQYDGPNVFASDGPRILAWPNCHRVWTLGGEEFVTGRAVMPSPLAVASDAGLREIRLYDGRELFRRFLPGGAKEFQATLVLDGTVQKDLVLVAEDVEGRRAVSFARRCWKDGSLASSFCSDHVNDGTMILAHGPHWYPVIRHPFLPTDVAGETWDGGPLASIPMTGNQVTIPALESDQGDEPGDRFDQTPLLEFADEGAVAVSSPHRERFDPRVERVVNPWHTYGPIAGPSELMEYVERYREWLPPTMDVPQTGWAAPGVRRGTNASLFTNTVVLKRDLAVRSLSLGYFPGVAGAVLAVSAQGKVRVADDAHPATEELVLQAGDWFGYFAARPSNANLFVVRGDPLRVQVRSPALFVSADWAGRAARQGDAFRYELAAIGFPIDVPIRGVEDLQRYLAYVAAPAGLDLHRGTRTGAPGLMELAADSEGAVEFALPKAEGVPGLTLPCRITGLNRRWSAGLFQKQGYVKGDYGPGENRYRALGVDLDGAAYVPVYPCLAERTHLLAGHPVVAGPEGRELFIQVTKVGVAPDRWHVSVDNPTDQPITTTLRAPLALPGLEFPERTVTLPPGSLTVFQ